MASRTVTVLREHQPRFLHRLKSLQNRCVRSGVTPPEITMIENVKVLYNYTEQRTMELPASTYTFDMPAPPKNKTVAIATIVYGQDTEGNQHNVVFARKDEDHALVERYRNAPPHCDHCGTKRARKEGVVTRDSTGNIMHVGKACFLNRMEVENPNRLIKDMMFSYALDEMLEDFEYTDTNGGLGNGVFTASPFWTIKAALEVINDQGFFVSTSAESSLNPSTKAQMLASGFDDPKSPLFRAVQNASDEEAIGVFEWCMNISKDEVGYLRNLKAAVARASLAKHTLGLLCSAPSAYRKALEEEQAEQTPQPNYFLSIGAKFGHKKDDAPPVEVTIVRKAQFDGFYGVKTVLTMDGDGARFVWFKSGYASGVSVGDTLLLSGTVKEQRVSDFDDTKTTFITRGRLFAAK